MAERVYALAQAINDSLFPVSRRDAMFKASTYYRSADFYLHGNWSDPRINSLWAQQGAAFDAALPLLPGSAKRVTIQADAFSVLAIWYGIAGTPQRRPTIIISGGYDGGQEELYHQMAKAALQRGWNAITYEGPGQGSVRREQNLGFILEWGKGCYSLGGLPLHPTRCRYIGHCPRGILLRWLTSASCGGF